MASSEPISNHCSRAISSTRGVSKIVRFGPYPVKVDNEIIDAIKSRLPQYEAVIQDKNVLKKGDVVRIKGDHFLGLEGIFECDMGSFRSAILISYLEKMNKLIVDNDLLEKVI
jgi:transcriptional antiterminator RfaH